MNKIVTLLLIMTLISNVMTTENPCSAIGSFSYQFSLTDGVVLWGTG